MSTATAKAKVRERKGAGSTTRQVKNSKRRAVPLAEPRRVVKKPSSGPPRSSALASGGDASTKPAAPVVDAAQSSSPPPEAKSARRLPTQAEALMIVSRRATAGNATCLEGLLKILNNKPEIWRAIGDVGAHVEQTWIQLLAGEQVLHQESVRRTLQQLKLSIGGEHPTAIEKLLIDVVGITWLAYHHAELTAGSNDSALHDRFFLQRAESAQKRFLAATKTLATLRELAPRGLRPLPVQS